MRSPRFFFVLAISALNLAPFETCPAATFNVDSAVWGDNATTGTLAWAIDQANNSSGADVIEILLERDARIDLNSATPIFVPAGNSFISEIRDTLTINGNGAILWGDPSFVTSGGLLKDKYTVSKLVGSDVLTQEAFSFTYIAPGIGLTINDLSADGVNGFVNLGDNAVANLTDVTVKNTVPYGHGSQSVISAASGAVVNLNRVVMDRINMLEELIPGAEFAWVGAVAGEDATLNMLSSQISGSSSSVGAVNWLGGTANIVSSIFESNAGGLSITDGDRQGVLNLVNSLLRFESGHSSTARVQANIGAVANVIASTIQVENLGITSSGDDYSLSGTPLRASSSGSIHLTQSAVSVLNQHIIGSDNDPAYDNGPLPGGGLGGIFSADAATYISPTSSQSSADIKALFAQPNLLTDSAFNIGTIPGDPEINFYDPLPDGAYPALGGNLINAVADADGTNQLINPIDGMVITTDVFGNPRTSNGLRDAGAVQSPHPIAGTDAIDRFPSQSVKVSVATLLSNDVDPETGTNAGLSITAVNNPGGSPAIVTLSGGTVFYDPNGHLSADTFEYTVQDSLGRTATGTVTVSLIVDNAPSMNIVSFKLLGDGSAETVFGGIPGRTYRVQSSDDLLIWTDRASVAADGLGRLIFTDPPPLPPGRYYRTVFP